MQLACLCADTHEPQQVAQSRRNETPCHDGGAGAGPDRMTFCQFGEEREQYVSWWGRSGMQDGEPAADFGRDTLASGPDGTRPRVMLRPSRPV